MRTLWKHQNSSDRCKFYLMSLSGFLGQVVRIVGALIGSEKGGRGEGERGGCQGEERYFHDKGLNTGLCLLLAATSSRAEGRSALVHSRANDRRAEVESFLC